VQVGEPDGDTDLLVPPDESIGFVCGRESGSAGADKAEQVLNRLADTIVQENRGAAISKFTLGGMPAIIIETYDQAEDSMLRHIYCVAGGRTYYIAVAMPPNSGRKAFPSQVMTMLDTLEWI